MEYSERYIHARRPLWHAAEAIRRGQITIGFVGGSITEPDKSRRWSDKIVDWFVAQYPGVTINVENAAKGATGSLSAILRIEEDIIACGCDLVFVETAVNDGEAVWGAGREGILRKLLQDGQRDVVITYTFSQGMYETMLKDEVPESICNWEELAIHYDLPSVFMSRYTLDLVMKGFLRWEEWLPDGLHPEHAGSRLYAEPVACLMKQEIATAQRDERPLPPPLHPDHWERVHALPLDEITRHGAWRKVRVRHIPSVKYMLYTPSTTSSLTFTFEGTGLIIHLMMSGFHAGYRLRIDNGEWIDQCKELPQWAFNCTDWVREDLPVSGLAMGPHTAEIQPMMLPNGRATNFELCAIGVIC